MPTKVSEPVPSSIQYFSIVHNSQIHSNNIVFITIKQQAVDKIVYLFFLLWIYIYYSWYNFHI